MRMTGVSVQPWCGREADHEGKVRRGCAHVEGMRQTCGRLCAICDWQGQHEASMGCTAIHMLPMRRQSLDCEET
jgi:hypothetical protein